MSCNVRRCGKSLKTDTATVQYLCKPLKLLLAARRAAPRQRTLLVALTVTWKSGAVWNAANTRMSGGSSAFSRRGSFDMSGLLSVKNCTIWPAVQCVMNCTSEICECQRAPLVRNETMACTDWPKRTNQSLPVCRCRCRACRLQAQERIDMLCCCCCRSHYAALRHYTSCMNPSIRAACSRHP
jgi:hypothetical protein